MIIRKKSIINLKHELCHSVVLALDTLEVRFYIILNKICPSPLWITMGEPYKGLTDSMNPIFDTREDNFRYVISQPSTGHHGWGLSLE